MSARATLLVIGHGRTDGLCHHLARVAKDELARLGAPVRTHDLLADGFDPVLRLAATEKAPTRATASDDALLARYQDDLLWARSLVIVHPVWWFAPPAILKGWVDRVLVDGVALRQPPEGPPVGTLEGRRALLVQTFGAPRAVDRVVFGGIAGRFWKRAVFMPVGIRDVRQVSLHGVDGITSAGLAAEEKALRRAVAKLAG